MTDKKNSRFNNILKDLTSKDEKKTLTAIKQLRKHGKPQAIAPLISLLNSSPSENITNSILSLLFDLKDQNTVDELILCIEDDGYESIKPILISIFWQSKLDGSSYIETFVKEAIKGNYLVGIEVMTIIDNFDEATFNEEEIDNLKYDLDDAIMNEANKEKAQLLFSIKESLGNLTIEY